LCNVWVACALTSCGLIEGLEPCETREVFLQEHCGKLGERGIVLEIGGAIFIDFCPTSVVVGVHIKLLASEYITVIVVVIPLVTY
jgi:hypothetical protein